MLTAIQARALAADSDGSVRGILDQISSSAADGYWYISIDGHLDSGIVDTLRSLGYNVVDVPPFGENNGWEISW